MAATLGYRPDIDGLRAVAVTAVIAGHAGWPGIPGGFIGVDVFFAISGFLITSLLLREQQRDGRIDIADFYARRIRRILPPLAIVLVATTLLGFALLLPTGEQQDLAQSALAATGFVSNLHFMQANSGYFAGPAQFNVLLHTWSLAIEEQFYLLWPLTLVGAGILARRWKTSVERLLIPTVAAGCAASFLLCLLVLERSPAAAFYFTPLRAWELGVGALLALRPPRGLARTGGAILGAGGLAIIAAAAVFVTSGSDFPLGALAATCGAVAVMAAGDLAPGGPATRLLAARPMVWVGKVSYGWYLWHWPLLSLARIEALGAPSLARDTAMVFAALALAILTWAMIERPSRTRWTAAFSPPHRAFMTGALLSLACVLAAAALWAWGSLHRSATPMTAAVTEAQRRPIAFEPACDGTDDGQTRPLPPKCVVGLAASPRAVVIWGDSHARHLVPGLADAAASEGLALIPQLKSGCRPGLTQGRYRRGPGYRVEERCRQFNRAVLADLEQMGAGRDLRGVIIASRWSRDDGWTRDLPELLQALRARGLRVVIVADPPSYPYDVPACLARRGLIACARDRGDMARRQAADTAALERIAAAVPGVRVWDPADVLCRDGDCQLMASGKVLYSDWHHLSPAGSALIGAHAADQLAWVAGRT